MRDCRLPSRPPLFGEGTFRVLLVFVDGDAETFEHSPGALKVFPCFPRETPGVRPIALTTAADRPMNPLQMLRYQVGGGITMFANLVDFAKFRGGEYPRFLHASPQLGPRDISHLPIEAEREVNQPLVRGSF